MTRKVATVLRAKSCIAAALLQIMFSMLTAEKFRHAQVCPTKVPLPGRARGGGDLGSQPTHGSLGPPKSKSKKAL